MHTGGGGRQCCVDYEEPYSYKKEQNRAKKKEIVQLRKKRKTINIKYLAYYVRIM
jgi:hypothetical protein